MFSKQIVNTDAFMDMPMSSQLLYFHLAMEADDDGFVSSPKRIMKLLGSSDDDFKVLIAKRFILPFQSGICVIKHWLIHNYIRNDTYQETKYIDEKNSLKIKDNRAYTERPLIVDVPSTQIRLGEVREDKTREGKHPHGEFQNVLLKPEEYTKLSERFGEKNAGILIEELSGYMESKKTKYLSHYATLLNWGRRKVVDHIQKIASKGKQVEL